MDYNKYPVAHPQVASRTVDGSAIVVLADSGLVKMFNPVGTRVWELADGTQSVREIVSGIMQEFDVDQTQAEQDVIEFLQQLIDTQALTLQDEPNAIKKNS